MTIIRDSNIFPFGKMKMTPEYIGSFVREERKRQGLRQDELAAAAHVGMRFLIELEGGKPTAQIGKVLHVLAALGVSLQLAAPDESD